MKRREFIRLAGAAAAWPITARAQQSAPLIGVLMNRAENDSDGKARLAAFLRALEESGWNVNRNVRMETRWGAEDVELERKYAAELVALSPDILLAAGTLGVSAVLGVSRTVPIVFAGVPDPVGAGFVDSLSRPGGNTTGFMIYEYSLGGKWLDLLKQIAPRLTRVAIIRDPLNQAGVAMFSAIQASAQSFGVQVSPIGTRSVDEVERAIMAFAHSPNSGLIATPSASVSVHRNLIVTLAARHKLPAVYPFRNIVTDGGLVSYGPDLVDQFRLAADYVDRILKGAKPADLPVQAPTKYELVINLKTAKALGLTVPPSLIARADEVIE
jgi:putative ABC transport system substrate-binding protein